MYKTVCIVLKNKDVKLKNYCSNQCKNAKLLKNAITYRLRQLFFAWQKDYISLSEHEIEVLDEFMTTYDKFPSISKNHMFPTYNQFEHMLRNTNNPDFFNGLPAHSSQYLIKNGLQDFKSYFNALKKYRENPSKFTSKPKLPKYAKSDEVTFSSSNQECKIIDGQLKLPKLNTKLNLGSLKINDDMRLYRVQIKPYYDTYKVCIIFEVSNNSKITNELNKKNVLGIDLGVDNIITTSNNCGLSPFVIKGNEIKSRNQWYNKLLAKYKSQLSISTKQNSENSKRITKLNKYRKNYITDKYNKIASYIVNYCKDNDIGTVVIGKNDQWKSEIDMRKKDKQNFVFISHSVLVNKIKMMAMKFDINVIEQEESYTSKASFLDNDDIPNYSKYEDDKNKKDKHSAYHKFSGKRIKRGLYKTKDGILINADVNAASNIIRKALSNKVFDDIQNFDYLIKTVISVRI